MRKFIFFVLVVLSFSTFSIAAPDTSILIHKIDGIIDEWPPDKFTTDKETSIQYSLDNDAQNLYVSMKIADQPEQAQILQMGMLLFIDMKGKRKQNTGVEFPLKNGDTRSDFNGLRLLLSLDPKMKLFGFSEAEPAEQDISLEGNVNIAFNWDSTDAMIIEYLVPLQMLEQQALTLGNKLISIGWKINGVDMPVTSTAPSNSVGGLPNNGITRPSKPVNNSVPRQMENMMKDQFIWTKYTLVGISN